MNSALTFFPLISTLENPSLGLVLTAYDDSDDSFELDNFEGTGGTPFGIDPLLLLAILGIVVVVIIVGYLFNKKRGGSGGKPPKVGTKKKKKK